MSTNRKCPICGKLYTVFAMYVGDQSKCGKCRTAEAEALERPSTENEDRRRREYFGGNR